MSSIDQQATYSAVVGQAIARFREERGLLQTDLALHLGVGQAAWSKIERGRCPLLSEHILRLAEALQIAPSEIWLHIDRAFEQVRSKNVRLVDRSAKAKAMTPEAIRALI
jgi:transcriptional regulator with XRE-family HTH domain